MSQLAHNLTELRAGGKINTSLRNVLTLDIERLPGSFTADFWDLNAFKGRRIHPDQVTEWPRTICVAWQVYGTKSVEFASEWDDGREAMLRRVWEAYDAADVLYGHNVGRFDTKHLNSEWRDLGLPPPSPFKVVDTLVEARRTFGDESRTLAALTQRLGIETKTDKYQVETARNALAGDKAAQRRLKAYNIGDIRACLFAVAEDNPDGDAGHVSFRRAARQAQSQASGSSGGSRIRATGTP